MLIFLVLGFFLISFFPPFILTQSAYCPPESRDALVCYLATVSTDTKLLPFSPVLLHHNSPLSPPVLFCVHFLKPADGANLLAPRVQWVSSGRSRGITGRRWSINCGQMKSSHHCHGDKLLLIVHTLPRRTTHLSHLPTVVWRPGDDVESEPWGRFQTWMQAVNDQIYLYLLYK